MSKEKYLKRLKNNCFTEHAKTITKTHRRITAWLISAIMALMILPTVTLPVSAIEKDTNYVEFTSNAIFSIKTADGNKSWDNKLQYSVDGINWNEWTGSKISSSANGALYLRGTGNERLVSSNNPFGSPQWEVEPNDSEIACSGNIETLLDYNKVKWNEQITIADGCFKDLFKNWEGLTVAPDLSKIETITKDCYNEMFSGCINLKTAPVLPALTMKDNCYYKMFHHCDSLQETPALPAKALAKECYAGMFSECENLTTANDLPAEILAEGCYKEMFEVCSKLVTPPKIGARTLAKESCEMMFCDCGDLENAPELNAEQLAENCYAGMFEDCISLINAPKLPAKNLEALCYQVMFKGCTKLKTAMELPAETLQLACYMNMFDGCSSLEECPALNAMNLEEYCYNSMFSGCTSLTTPIELPATILKANCYSDMFNGCSNIEVSETKTDVYSRPWSVPSGKNGSDAGVTDWNTDMLAATGASSSELFKGSPVMNTIYYLKATPLLVTDLKYTAPTNLEFDGQKKEAVVKPNNGVNCGKITFNYYDANGKKLTEAPTEIGTYTVKVSVESNDKYQALHETEIGSFTIADTKAPTINTENGKKYCVKFEAEVKDASKISGVSIDGKEVQLNNGKFTVLPKDTAQTIVVKDVAGNTTTVSVTVYAEHQWDEGVVTVKPTQTSEGVLTLTCSVDGEKTTVAIPKLPADSEYVAPDTGVKDNAIYYGLLLIGSIALVGIIIKKRRMN